MFSVSLKVYPVNDRFWPLPPLSLDDVNCRLLTRRGRSIKAPPPVIDSAKLLVFAVNDDEVTYTGRLSLHVGIPPDMEQIGELPGIVVTNPYNNPDDYLIGFCDESWNVKGVVATDSLEKAKSKAETYYSGISSKWQASPYSDNEVRSFLKDEYEVDPDTAWWEIRCSFCGKESSEVSGLLASDRATICHECVTAFYENYLGNDR